MWDLTLRQWYLIMRAQRRKEELRWAPHAEHMRIYVQSQAKPGKKYKSDDFNPYVERFAENEGIKTGDDARKLMEQLRVEK